ncbi:MAG TPA: LamG domain-containing protein, partial [Thermoplasmata archaeon]|nr:LamG domain-containing protein [Thermoplasmata archaeon]
SEATILAEIVPTDRNLSSVTVNITTPNGTMGNYTMTEIIDNVYIYTLDNISQNGQFNFTIWVTDIENNTNSSTGNFTMIVPLLSFETPTPSNYVIRNQNWVNVNVTVLDPLNTSAFIDWNYSLKGYWPMDLSNTTGIYDNSSYENFGTFEGGMNATNVKTGMFGAALEFDGYDDDVDLGANSSLSLGTGDFTFMIWEKSHQTSYDNKAVLLTNRPSDASMKGYIFGVQNTPYLYLTQSTGNNITLSGETDVTDSAWHHIAFIRRGTNHSIYVDGAYDSGVTGSMKNITNNQHTYLSYGHMGNCAYFDGVLDEPQLYNRALSREEINASYNNGLYLLYYNFTGLTEGDYSYSAHAMDTSGNMSQTETRTVTIDFNPQISNVSAAPHTVGFGYNVTIIADVIDTGSGVSNVSVNITSPDEAQGNYAMTWSSGDAYQYVFTDTWLAGQYNYTIWATDNSSNINSSSGHHFHVSAQASMSIATLKDSYSGSQYINITDPPNPPENYTLVARGFTWNTYYNASSGQNILETYPGPVNYQEENETWIPINNTINSLSSDHPAYVYGYRTGNDQGLYGVYFKSNAQQEWPVAFTFNRSDDPTIHAIRSKLVGVGYVDPQSNWAYQYLQSVQSSQGQTNDYSITYPGVFTGTDVTWSYGNTGLKEEITLSNATKTILQNHPPSQYGLNNASSYLVFITKLDYQNLNLYNDSGLLDGNITISDIGVEFKNILGQFKCALPLGEAYELNNETARQKLTYRIIHLNGNTYLLSGLDVSDLNAMTFPVVVDPTLTVYSSSNDGYIYANNANYNTVRNATSGTVGSSATTLYLGQRKFGSTYFVYRGFILFNTTALPSNAYIDNATISLYKNSDYSSTDFLLTVQNGQPTYPHSPLQSTDYNKDYYSGNGGSFNTSGFGSGYNNINLNTNGISWLNKTGWTKLCLRSNRDINGNAPTGNEFVIVYANEYGSGYQPKLVINYRNQSKIKNTGSTNIKGYLLIQVQYYDSGKGVAPRWVVDNDTVNETSPRTINSGNQLALDTIFNGKIRASNLQHGTGTYRVYAAFRDPDGNILKTNDGAELKAWWQFSKT